MDFCLWGGHFPSHCCACQVRRRQVRHDLSNSAQECNKTKNASGFDKYCLASPSLNFRIVFWAVPSKLKKAGGQPANELQSHGVQANPFKHSFGRIIISLCLSNSWLFCFASQIISKSFSNPLPIFSKSSPHFLFQ